MTDIEQQLHLDQCEDVDVLEYAIYKCISLIKIGCEVSKHRKLLAKLKSKLKSLTEQI